MSIGCCGRRTIEVMSKERPEAIQQTPSKTTLELKLYIPEATVNESIVLSTVYVFHLSLSTLHCYTAQYIKLWT